METALDMWLEFIAPLSNDDFHSADNILIGSVLTGMPPETMREHLKVVRDVLGEEVQDGAGNLHNEQ